MTIKGQNVINLKIITINDGKEIDNVKDIIYDPKQNRVRALLISNGGWFSDAKVLLMEEIKNIGQDAVIIDSSDAIKKSL